MRDAKDEIKLDAAKSVLSHFGRISELAITQLRSARAEQRDNKSVRKSPVDDLIDILAARASKQQATDEIDDEIEELEFQTKDKD